MVRDIPSMKFQEMHLVITEQVEKYNMRVVMVVNLFLQLLRM